MIRPATGISRTKVGSGCGNVFALPGPPPSAVDNADRRARTRPARSLLCRHEHRRRPADRWCRPGAGAYAPGEPASRPRGHDPDHRCGGCHPDGPRPRHAQAFRLGSFWSDAVLCFLAGMRRGPGFRPPGGPPVSEVGTMSRSPTKARAAFFRRVTGRLCWRCWAASPCSGSPTRVPLAGRKRPATSRGSARTRSYCHSPARRFCSGPAPGPMPTTPDTASCRAHMAVPWDAHARRKTLIAPSGSIQEGRRCTA